MLRELCNYSIPNEEDGNDCIVIKLCCRRKSHAMETRCDLLPSLMVTTWLRVADFGPGHVRKRGWEKGESTQKALG